MQALLQNSFFFNNAVAKFFGWQFFYFTESCGRKLC